MNIATLESSSPWLDVSPSTFSRVTRDQAFDIVVVGGGITGLTAAYLLKRSGKKVAVVEKGRLAGAETGHTTAHLTFVTDSRLKTLVKDFGKESARLVWQGGAAAISTIETIVESEDLECEFQRVPGFLCAAFRAEKHEVRDLEEEAELARELGFNATFVSAAPVFNRPAIRFSDQAQFHPVKYCLGLAKRIQGDGSEIFEQSEFTEAQEDPAVAVVNNRKLTFERLVIATHVPLVGLTSLASATLFQTKIAGYSTYAIGAHVPAGLVPHAEYWDTDDPYYYLRIQRQGDQDLVIFGGEDHKTGQIQDTEPLYQRLDGLLHEFVPEAVTDRRWSGQVIETNDGLPYIGESAKRQFVATGFSGNGMTLGTLAGMMATDWVLDRANPWADLFSLSRKSLRAGLWDYLKENFDYPYHLLKEYLATPEVDSTDDIPLGGGKIVRIDGHRCAASRGDDGKLTLRSAICTHMGCVVRWNSAEKSWDCPCHGSRFNPDGEVMAGPAETPLAPVENSKP